VAAWRPTGASALLDAILYDDPAPLLADGLGDQDTESIAPGTPGRDRPTGPTPLPMGLTPFARPAGPTP